MDIIEKDICLFRFSIRVQCLSLVMRCQMSPNLWGKFLRFQRSLILHFEHQVVELPIYMLLILVRQICFYLDELNYNSKYWQTKN